MSPKPKAMHFMRGVALADEELEVVAGLADAARRGGDVQAAAAEQGPAVAVAEGAEALEVVTSASVT